MYCLEHVLKVNEYITFSEEQLISDSLIKKVLCVVFDLKLSAITMCSQISHLHFLHGQQTIYFSEQGELWFLQEYTSNF